MKDFIYHHALGNIDVYPASYNGIPRSEKESGWNDCVFKMHDNMKILSEWYKELYPRDQMLIENYSNDIQITISEAGTIALYVVLNDVFIPAADMEEITIEELRNLEVLYDDFGYDAFIAYYAHKNNHTSHMYGKFSATVKDALKILINSEEYKNKWKESKKNDSKKLFNLSIFK